MVLRALSRDPRKRYATAQEFAAALTVALPPATPVQVTQWLNEACGRSLRQRAAVVADVESETLGDDWPPKHLLALRTPVVIGAAAPKRLSMVGGLGVLALFVGAGWFAFSRSAPVAMPMIAPRPVPLPPAPGVVAQPLQAPIDPASVQPPTLLTVPASAPASSQKLQRNRRRRNIVVRKAMPTPKPTPQPASKPDCEIPWVIGANGVRTPKAGCF